MILMFSECEMRYEIQPISCHHGSEGWKYYFTLCFYALWW